MMFFRRFIRKLKIKAAGDTDIGGEGCIGDNDGVFAKLG